ncbi:peptide chain release factor 1 [bacterium]|nr:peptide chain release factor 1 [bacterium]
MFPSLQDKLKRFEELEQQLQDPDVLSDTNKLLAIQREHGGLAKIANQVRTFNRVEEDIETAKEMVREETDHEAKEMAREELADLQQQYETLREELEEIVLSGDTLTRGSCILEIRAGTGGDEAGLFARDLFEMYRRYIEISGWKFEILELNASEMGGMKEVTLSVSGEGCYHRLQFESGGHRVQRVPETEAQGRIHTSAATVAVMPEATEVEIEINDEDLQIDTMRAGGPGGQKVNKTESAVRITHIPTGEVVKIQDEKSQHKNRAKAMRVLRSRLLERAQQNAANERAEHRRTLVGSGDRSQRIRTYNFPQNRVTDHRINVSIHKLDQIMAGNLDELVNALLEFDKRERLEGGAR